MNTAKYLTLTLLLFISPYLFAQNSEDDNYDPAGFMENQSTNTVVENNIEDKEKNSKLSYNIELGSSFTSNPVFGSSLDFYTAPQINYNFTPRLQISAGAIFINSTIPSYYLNDGSNTNGSTNITRSYLFNRVSYRATEKLRISGEILYGMNKNPYRLMPGSKKNEYIMNFNAEYKINENFKIGLQLSGTNMNSPYGYSPYGNSPFQPLNMYQRSPMIGF